MVVLLLEPTHISKCNEWSRIMVKQNMRRKLVIVEQILGIMYAGFDRTGALGRVLTYYMYECIILTSSP